MHKLSKRLRDLQIKQGVPVDTHTAHFPAAQTLAVNILYC
jgi:hypothetical protein